MRTLAAIVVKDLRLLFRDRSALAFIVVAPVVVICVAGFSLASLYGATPTGQTAYELPIVDEDGGELAREIERRLSGRTSLRVLAVGSRAEARQLVASKSAGSALVIPAGTAAALAAGQPANVLLYTDPVKYLERLNVRLEVLRARDDFAAEQRTRVVAELGEQRRKLREQLDNLSAALARGRLEVEMLQAEASDARDRAASALAAQAERARQDVARQIDRQTQALLARLNDELTARASAVQSPARAYLAELADARARFDAWFGELQRLAARRADDIPPPPEFPEPPQELVRALDEPPPRLELPADLEIGVALAAPALPDSPTQETDLFVPPIYATTMLADEPAIPGAALGVEEIAVGTEEGAESGPTAINTFDQNVPGFSVTFLLLGMLLGVSLGLLDERDWGTFDRVRALPVAAGDILLGKLLSRFAVGVVQMVVLFGVGFALFDISLGPEPWALLLPITGVAFAGTAFGLVVAVFARTRDAVLPLGSIVIVTMAAVGGCWWPIDLEPQWMRGVALAFPTTWAMEAFNDLMIRRRTWDAAVVPAVVLVAYGLAYLAVGLALFRRQIARDRR
jgi:ABC-type multidrug transport system permease subunit